MFSKCSLIVKIYATGVNENLNILYRGESFVSCMFLIYSPVLMQTAYVIVKFLIMIVMIVKFFLWVSKVSSHLWKATSSPWELALVDTCHLCLSCQVLFVFKCTRTLEQGVPPLTSPLIDVLDGGLQTSEALMQFIPFTFILSCMILTYTISSCLSLFVVYSI